MTKNNQENHLIKKIKVQTMKPYPKYKDSGVEWIGEIPQEWQARRLKYIVVVNPSKSTLSIDKNSSKDVCFLSMERVNVDGTFLADLFKPINEVYNGFTYFEENDVIFAKITPCFENGKGALLDSIPSKIGFGSTEFHVLRTINGKSIPKFIYYLTVTHMFRTIGEAFMSGAAGQKRVPTDFAENFIVTCPSIQEQHQIAAYLDNKTSQIDTLLEKKKRLIALLKEERTAIINQAVTKGLDPNVPMKDSGIEWLGEIPEHWEVKRLKHLISDKLMYGANEIAELDDKSLPRYIRITDFGDNGKLREETFKSLPIEIAKNYMLADGDILFARSGATVGKTYQFKNYQGNACFAGYLIKATPDKNKILSDFMYYATRSNSYENWKKSIFNQATIQNIGADKYNNFSLAFTFLEEQQQIVSYLNRETSRIDTIITKAEKQIELLQEYRTALISEVVTGKVDIRECNI
ncbi:MAG: restriction endonuclease subunit S [Desulfobacterales bacterium]|nr:restriction endonuclease subunit S [Desulfobacterales bacterium]